MRRIATILIAACGFALTSCKREERSFRVPPSAAEAPANVPALDSVRPGPAGEALPTSPTTVPSDLPVLSTEPLSVPI